jgi:carbon monoxide dehydrogenase subunit G
MADDLTFGGEEAFAAPVERVFAAVTDLDSLARLLPDVESSERVDERTVRCVVRPGVSFLRGKLTTTITLADVNANESAVLRLESKGVGVQIAVEAILRFEAHDSGSKLTWQAQVTRRTGLVAAISSALIRGAAEQTIRRGWQNLRAKLETP